MTVHSSSFNSWHLYGASLALLLFYAWVAWSALNPKVSEAYQAYFIEHTDDCWRQATKPTLQFGGQLPFGFQKPAHTCQVLAEGWDATGTPWGTWSTQHHATLHLHLESDAHQKAHLRFFVLGFDPFGLQNVSVFVGNEFKTEWHPQHEMLTHYDLEASLSQAQTTVKIHFLFSDPLSMKWLDKATNNLDHRLLGMGLLGIDWVIP